MDLNSYMLGKKQSIDKFLDSLVPENEEIPVITDAMRYSLFAGGKRLRPILALMACEMFGGNEDEVLPFACCIELIHTYSLIHDDLPAMDNDDFRRGKLTNHKVYGEGFAVLAGDALLNQAFEIMSDIITKKPRIEYIKTMNTISRASGVNGMIGGQCIDLYFENKNIDIDTLKNMHNKKTGAIITASLAAGALIAGAAEQDVKSMEQFGAIIGLAFQVTDDILDVEGTIEKIGKSTNKDLAKNKSNFISFYGLQQSKRIASDLISEAKKVISAYGAKGYYLSELANYISSRDN
ncbi:MAG: polyprenyl synthetase family protein [Caulobacteraceae bacterium]